MTTTMRATPVPAPAPAPARSAPRATGGAGEEEFSRSLADATGADAVGAGAAAARPASERRPPERPDAPGAEAAPPEDAVVGVAVVGPTTLAGAAPGIVPAVLDGATAVAVAPGTAAGGDATADASSTLPHSSHVAMDGVEEPVAAPATSGAPTPQAGRAPLSDGSAAAALTPAAVPQEDVAARATDAVPSAALAGPAPVAGTAQGPAAVARPAEPETLPSIVPRPSTTTAAVSSDEEAVRLPLQTTPSAPGVSAAQVTPAAATAATGAATPVAAPSASAPAAPAPAPQLAPLADQLRVPLGALRALPLGEHILTLRVEPRDLGPVQVRAHLGADGLRVELVGATDAIREQLRGVLHDLRRDLAASGGGDLQLDEGTISERERREQGEHSPGTRAEHRASTTPATTLPAGSTTTTTTTSDASRPGGVDVVA